MFEELEKLVMDIGRFRDIMQMPLGKPVNDDEQSDALIAELEKSR